MAQNINVEEILEIYNGSVDSAIRYIERTYGVEHDTATAMVQDCYNKAVEEQSSALYDKIKKQKEHEIKEIKRENLKADIERRKEARAERREARAERRDKFFAWCEDYSSKANTVHCPKCHSTSISYDTKKVSVGRAIVGNAVAGPTGAIIGGLSSNKGYAVCLNCGKRWKI